MTRNIEGGCLCGQVRYTGEAEPVVTLNCHCRDCQMTSGSTHLPALVIPRDSLTVTGEPTIYATSPERGGTARRAFCPTCGTPVFGYSEATEFVVVHAATLDDPSWFAPQMDIYAKSALPWDRLDPDLPRFEKMPPMEEG